MDDPRSILFFTAVYNVEWLVLQAIYVLNKEILQFLGLKSEVDYCFTGACTVHTLHQNIFYGQTLV